MLVNSSSSNYKKGDIVSMKLATGEEIISKFVREEDNNWFIEKPLMLIQTPQGIGFSFPLASGTEIPELKIEKSRIVFHSPTEKNAEAAYLSAAYGVQVEAKPSIITAS